MSVVQWTTGIQHIGIPTSDIETTIRFYEGLGFQTMHTNQVPANKAKVAFLQLGNLMIELMPRAATVWTVPSITSL